MTSLLKVPPEGLYVHTLAINNPNPTIVKQLNFPKAHSIPHSAGQAELFVIPPSQLQTSVTITSGSRVAWLGEHSETLL